MLDIRIFCNSDLYSDVIDIWPLVADEPVEFEE